MRRFKRHGAVISSNLSADEVQLLESLLRQLIEMLDTGDPSEPPAGAEESGESDPFAAWAREMTDDAEVPPPEDPVLRRLLPDAYPNDPKASAEFRRFTDRDLRQKKSSDAEVALRHLAETGGGVEPLRIPVQEAQSWLRALTSLRLAVAGRLGISDMATAEELAEIDEDDPRAYMVSIYEWLGFAQETLVGAL